MSAGFSKALSYATAPQSPKLVLAARDSPRFEAVAEIWEGLAVTTLVMPTDVGDPRACAEAVQSAFAKFSTIDVLVNNAGMLMWATVEDVQDVSRFQHLMNVHAKGSVYCTKLP